MSSPEKFSNPETELTLLRSELHDLFLTHHDKIELYQPEDLNEPVELVLGGFCTFLDDKNEPWSINVHIRQRMNIDGPDYLVIMNANGYSYWREIAPTFATEIFNGHELPLDQRGAEILRFHISPDRTEWKSEYSREYMSHADWYGRAQKFANRNNH